MDFEERSTHVYRQKRMFTKEELEAREGLCIYNEPAYCAAACPLKLDVRELVRSLSGNDFTKARQIYERIAVFPQILSHGCDAPCQTRCKLSEFGEEIQIRQLEAAAMKYGEPARTGGMLRMQKKQKVCICGTSLFTLFLAGELAAKKYPLTILCREATEDAYFERCAGEYFDDFILLEEDRKKLKKLNITWEYAGDMGLDEIRQKKEMFDVFCVSEEVLDQIAPDHVTDSTLAMCFQYGVVAPGKTETVLEAAFAAKRAALTVDRLAQKLAPDNSRGEEGPCETKLITDTEGLQVEKQIPAGETGYTKDEALREARRCIVCSCDECMKGCAYLQHYKKFPRVLTREIYNNVSIIMGDHMMNKAINACALCGQCTVTCPNGYDMAQICHVARENMVATDKMPLATHEFALQDMLFSNGEAFLCRKQPGYDSCRYVFFPGCQAAAIAPDTVKAAYLDLCSRLEGGVALILGCCGAICDWAGRYEMYGETVRFLDEKWGELGCPEVIAGCPTCKKELSSHEKMKVTGIWETLLSIGLPEGGEQKKTIYALHDSCGAREDPQVRRAVRQLIEKMGITLKDTPYSGDRSPCCGYGGLTAYANREVAKEMTQKCLERSELPYISYCMACRDRFAREGRQSRHLLELIYDAAAFEVPDISQKRYHRLTLKNQLLKEVWRENMEELNPEFEIEYTPEALELMDDRMILKSDVEAVMKQVRQSGEAIFDEETNLMITRMRLGNVTFWVKYQETETGYRICRAYSHRMNVEKRLG